MKAPSNTLYYLMIVILGIAFLSSCTESKSSQRWAEHIPNQAVKGSTPIDEHEYKTWNWENENYYLHDEDCQLRDTQKVLDSIADSNK